MKKALALSMLLHLCLLASMRGCGGEGGGSPSASDEDIVPKMTDPVLISEVDVHATEPRQKKLRKPECKDWYGGIGVWYSGDNFLGPNKIMVNDAPAGYPAYQAGIRPRDIIEFTEDMRGEPGTNVQVTVIHPDGTEQALVLTRDKICTEPKKK